MTEKSAIPHRIEIERIPDSRGSFAELFRSSSEDSFNEFQINHSRSKEGVLRGMHFSKKPAWKKIFCLRGSINGAVINLSKVNGIFGQVTFYQLNEESSSLFYVPENHAHGFQVISDVADVVYVTNCLFSKDDDFAIDALDSDLKLNWNLTKIIRSERDSKAMSWENYSTSSKWSN